MMLNFDKYCKKQKKNYICKDKSIKAQMLKQDRFSSILSEVTQEGSVSLQMLSNKLSVSEDTVRRDLKEMDAQGLLRAVRGGAVSIARIPHHYRDRERTDIEQKQAIARKAIDLIKPEQVLFFDGGTSVLELAKIIPPDYKVTIITHSFPVANVVEDHPSAELIFLGGRLNKTAFATYGHETLTSISKFQVDYYFFGVTSITVDSLFCKDLEDAEVKRRMMQHSRKVVGLCTTDKLNTEASYFIEQTKKLNILISEKEADDRLLHTYTTLGIQTL